MRIDENGKVEKTMTNPRNFDSLLAVFLLIAAVLACSTGTSNSDVAKANQLVNEGNAAVEQGKKFALEAEDKQNAMLQMNVRRIAEARVIAAGAIAAYDKAAEKCKEAAQKYDEASRLKISEKFKQYLMLKVKEYNKRAELVEVAKDTPQALIESTNRSSFVIRVNSNNEKVANLSKEADELASQSDKLQKENPGDFK
jgi:malonyl CoA-acyl carrier protein transacylase